MQDTSSVDSDNIRPINNSRLIDDYDDISVAKFLSEWCISYDISHSAIGALLHGLKPFVKCPDDLPCDVRTLLNSPRNYDIQTVTGGEYFYWGIEAGLTEQFKRHEAPKEEAVLELQFNCLKVLNLKHSLFCVQ